MKLDFFIVGLGDVGRRVARHYLDQCASVGALSRTAPPTELAGCRWTHADLDVPASLTELPIVGSGVFYFAPPATTGTGDVRMQAWLASLHPYALPRKVVMISTTAVYGDCAGAWITELTPAHPDTDRGRRRLAAEQLLQAWSGRSGVPSVILRVAGIYGAARLPIDKVRAGAPVIRADEAWFTNRIHEDDLTQVCVAAMARAPAGAIYNVADGQPSTMTDYFYQIADLFALPRPPAVTRDQAQTTLSPAMWSYLNESKRIDNRKMLDELGIKLRYPSLREGLAAIKITLSKHS
ncbi:MAG: NAD-dependent epimerase/dehydratase family protein [Pseudomonadota bacterium]